MTVSETAGNPEALERNDPATRAESQPRNGAKLAARRSGMPRPTIVPVTPRVLNTITLCAYIGRSPTWLAENRAQLEAEGFPRPDPLLGGYDRMAVDLWLDRRSGILCTAAMTANNRSWDKSAK